jgi:type I restriction enzyme S subunit
MSNWKKYNLSELADIKLSNVDKKEYPNQRQIRLCNYTDVYKNNFINSEIARDFMISTCSELEYQRFNLKQGQVAITKDSEKRNDIGISTYISESFDDIVLGYHLALISPKFGKLDGKFLNYWLSSKFAKTYFENNAGGSGQRCTLTIDIIRSIPLIIPEFDIQIQISKLLFDLDSKIELNNRINAELEAMAKTIYDYWFVQFDFPDKNGKPYKTSGGKLVWNEELKREIPEGWEVKKLYEIENNIITGKTPSTTVEEYFGGDIPFVTIDDIRKQLYILKSFRTLSKFGADSQSSKYLQPGDICVSCIGTIGVIGLVGTECQTNQQINSISIKRDFNRFFLLNALQMHFEFNSSSAKQGAVLVNMNKGEFAEIKILDPTKELKETYHDKVRSSYNKIENNLKQNLELAELRDWLLPMLMNGQVKVS